MGLQIGELVPRKDIKLEDLKGKVIAVGDVLDLGKAGVFTTEVGVGQRVIFKKWTNQEIKFEGKDYLLVKFDELLAILE